MWGQAPAPYSQAKTRGPVPLQQGSWRAVIKGHKCNHRGIPGGAARTCEAKLNAR